ncbi:MAG: VOC family protein [Myxococcota bacterium]
MAPSRVFFNITTLELEKTKTFYTELLGFRVTFDSDWFVQLSGDADGTELGILLRTHELVPPEFRDRSTGGILTVVVENTDDVFERAKAQARHIVEPPKDLFYGQRRMLLLDPAGTLVDVSAPTAPLNM